MRIEDLGPEWTTTRETLQAYAQALTAAPRVAAPADPHWSHVSMDPTLFGFVTAATPLADGTMLESALDLHLHRIVITAGDDRVAFDMTDGPSAHEVGTAVLTLASNHGSDIEADPDRFADTESREYSAEQAARFLTAAHMAVSVMSYVNEHFEGAVLGPHLWPHGFDIATEWISQATVDVDGAAASPQVAMGWFPAAESYIYVNPWPFDHAFPEIPLPHGAQWHLDGWQGAKLDVPVGGSLNAQDAADVGVAVHRGVRPTLEP